MVDYCLVVKPSRRGPEEKTIQALCRQRPGLSINHTDWGSLCRLPIALSIETKRPGGDFSNASLQIGTWHSAQWRGLTSPAPRPNARRKMEFLPGIIIHGHEWLFVATVPDAADGQPVLYTKVLLGSTEKAFGICKLIASLQHLRQWTETIYWPAFQADVLGHGTA